MIDTTMTKKLRAYLATPYVSFSVGYMSS